MNASKQKRPRRFNKKNNCGNDILIINIVDNTIYMGEVSMYVRESVCTLANLCVRVYLVSLCVFMCLCLCL